MRRLALCFALCLTGQGAWAEPPATSPRPIPRVLAGMVSEADSGTTAAPLTSIRPMSPPASRMAGGIQAPELQPPEIQSTETVQSSEPGETVAALRPRSRPDGLGERVAGVSAPEPEQAPAKGKPTRQQRPAKGSVCGDPEIKGEVLAAIRGKVKGCGLENPVRVTQVAGIRLNEPAILNCETAKAFKTWINKGLRPVMGRREVVELRIAASYICRPRNNQRGAKISEHGRGKAVDVAGFVFADGTQWAVVSTYNRHMRKAHKAACGIFGTTLGPGSDGYHEDHLHFDTASDRSGPYCK